MKAKPEDFDIPAGALFTQTHEYVLWDEGEDRARVGISHFAAEQLGDVVYVEFPDIGEMLEQGDSFGTIESVKAASDLYMPISGEILAINTQLTDEPELVNDNCYGDGWMLEVLLKDPAQLKTLMSAEQYIAFLAESAGV
jgi:glycine cleavage system H protein